MKIKIELEIELGEDFMDESDPFASNWLWNEVLAKDNICLHSNEIGDTVGEILTISNGRILHPAAAVSAPVEDWISVEDRLPEMGEDILCIQKDNDLPLMANYNNKGFEVKKYPCPSDRVLIAYWDNITHWRPLPAPAPKKPAVEDKEQK